MGDGQMTNKETSDFEVGRIIIGRGIDRYNKGEIKEFRIVKVGAKYIYIKENSANVPDFMGKAIYKDSLEGKDPNDRFEYFFSLEEMKEHDEAKKLLMEICDIIYGRNNIKPQKKLRAIKELLSQERILKKLEAGR
jgi:hypothetical protein